MTSHRPGTDALEGASAQRDRSVFAPIEFIKRMSAGLLLGVCLLLIAVIYFSGGGSSGVALTRHRNWVYEHRVVGAEVELEGGGAGMGGLAGSGVDAKELQMIIRERDKDEDERTKKMQDRIKSMVTRPWATMHPRRLERDEARDEMLVKQAKKQEQEDDKLLYAALEMHAKDQALSNGVSTSSNGVATSSNGLGGSDSRRHALAALLKKSQSESQKLTAAEHVLNKHIDTHVEISSDFVKAHMHAKAEAHRRLKEKEETARHVYVDEADQRAHHTVETLPMILPPVGVGVLLVLGCATVAVKKWQNIPGGVGAARRQDINELRNNLGRGKDAVNTELSWQEMGQTV